MARNTPPAAETPPEDTPGIGMDEAELGSGTSTMYFTKVPKQDAWHAHSADHDPIGLIKTDPITGKWKARLTGGETVSHDFGSATSAKAYLLGWYDRGTSITANPRGEAGPNPASVHAPNAKPADAAGGTTIVG